MQPWPHDPQLLMSVSVLVQVGEFGSQRAYGAKQGFTRHRLEVQVAAPVQVTPHAPQLGLSSRKTQRPLQMPCPGMQAQVPLTQFLPFVQTLPQVPQFDGSLTRSRQTLSQDALPVGQVTHARFVQVWFAAQTVPQAPQLLRSRYGSTHTVPHARSGK
jgi:hypothetical protein